MRIICIFSLLLCGFITREVPSSDDLTARYVSVPAMQARAREVEQRLSTETDPAQARQYRVIALALTAARKHTKPFTNVEVMATFTAPSSATFTVPGFYDGNGVWKIRFMPYETGVYRWTTTCSVVSDIGLNGRQGSFNAAPAAGNQEMARRGGHLRVGTNKHHLTYTDGTPFFWLGDTWWFVPTPSFPYDKSWQNDCSSVYQLCIQLREKQRYNMLTVGFLGEYNSLLPKNPDKVEKNFEGKDLLFHVETWDENSLAFWRQVDRYILYADEAGIGMTMNMIWSNDLPMYKAKGLSDQALLDLVWPVHRYLIARLGSYNVIWHVVAEYNHEDNRKANVVPVIFALGARMRALDPYKDRPMTIFPWPRFMVSADDAWNQPWHGFKLFQGGHFQHPWEVHPAATLRTGFFDPPTQPTIIGEHNFERIFDKKNDSGDVRAAAWRSMMCGAAGVTYGATGLWYPNKDENDKVKWEWGNNAWFKALDYPGAGQMGLLRSFFEKLPWWDMHPLPDAVRLEKENQIEYLMPTAAAYGERTVICYIPGGLNQDVPVSLALPTGAWKVCWFDPRTGAEKDIPYPAIVAEGNGLRWKLPGRPDSLDWVVVAEKLITK
jgi:hypothetical protein